jgi:hypothetical protein
LAAAVALKPRGAFRVRESTRSGRRTRLPAQSPRNTRRSKSRGVLNARLRR